VFSTWNAGQDALPLLPFTFYLFAFTFSLLPFTLHLPPFPFRLSPENATLANQPILAMKNITCLSAAVLFCSFAFAQQMNTKTLAYPATKKVDTVDTYFGTRVPDPYRWLEDDRAPDTKAWVQEQNKVTGLP